MKAFIFLKENRSLFFLLRSSASAKSEFFFIYGAVLHRLGKYKRSSVYLKKSLYNPFDLNLSEIYYFLILNYIKLNKIDFAKNYFNKLLERSFDAFYIFLIYYEFNVRKIDSAISYQSIATLLPDQNDQDDNKLAHIVYFLVLNEVENAFNLLKIEFKNDNYVFYYNLILIRILFKLKYYDEIVEYFNDNIDYLSGTDFLFIYSAALYKLKLFDESFNILNEIKKLNPDNAAVNINLGKILLIKKKYIKALLIFKNAYNKTAADKDLILFYMSISYQKLGLLNDMIKCLSKINPLSAVYNKALFNLSLTCYELSFFNKACNYFIKIDSRFVDIVKYAKWENIIKRMNYKKEKRLFFLGNIVLYLPVIIIVFIFIVFFIFMIIRN